MRHEARALFLTLIACALIGSFLIYRPDDRTPFDIVDFTAFLSFLTEGSSFSERFRGLAAYFMHEQGRTNVVIYALIAAKWTLWGNSPEVWQLFRFVLMWAVMTLTYMLLRRLGVRRFAAVVGVSVFLVAPAAIDGWERLTIGEPLGTVLVLLICLLAVSDKGWTNRFAMGIVFFVLAVALVWVKEMMIVALILPLGLAGIQFRATPSAEYRQRFGILLLGLASGVAVALIPVGFFALQAKPDSYVGFFGSRMQSVSGVTAHWLLGLLPFGVGAFPGAIFGVALLAFAAFIIGGWTLHLKTGHQSRSGDKKLLVLALLLPLVGAVEYIPWPFYLDFYALPYLLGASLLIGFAHNGLVSGGRALATAATGIWLAFMFFAGADAWGNAERMRHRQLAIGSMVDRVSTLSPDVDSVFFASDLKFPEPWPGIGPTLQRYGRALGKRMPVMVDVPCQAARDRLPAPRRARVFYSPACPHAVTRDPLVERFRRLTPSLRLVTDSFRVDVVGPLSPVSLHGATGHR